VHVLLKAWQKWGGQAPELYIIGEGPERNRLERMVHDAGMKDTIRFWGQLPFQEAQEKLAESKLLILPSLCFEGFPMVIREAFALGVPVAASRLGPLPDIVEENKNGLLFDPDNAESLLECIRQIWIQPALLAEMGKNARADFEDKYTADKNYAMLMDIYQKAIEARRKRNK